MVSCHSSWLMAMGVEMIVLNNGTYLFGSY